jgi:hypothetical protein
VAAAESPAPTSGYDRGFFIQSGDGDYRLNAGMLAQTRYIANVLPADAEAASRVQSGFQLRRTQLDLSGRSPRFTFRQEWAAWTAVGQPDVLKAVAEVSAAYGRTSALAAAVVQQLGLRHGAGDEGLLELDGARQFGVVAQVARHDVPDRLEAFVRHDWIHFDGVYWRRSRGAVQTTARRLDFDQINLTTAGVNVYLDRHRAKLTLDGLYAFDPVFVANPGAGLLASPRAGQIVARTQLQVRF